MHSHSCPQAVKVESKGLRLEVPAKKGRMAGSKENRQGKILNMALNKGNYWYGMSQVCGA